MSNPLRNKKKLGSEVNSILYIRNLPYKSTTEELYDLFGKGNTNTTRGTAFVVYEDIYDAKSACDHLQGFNVGGRYLVVLYHNQNRGKSKKEELDKKEKQLNELRSQYLAMNNATQTPEENK